MKIALATDWFTPRAGGIETQLEQLASCLGARGHSVDVITSTPGTCDGHSFRVKRLDVTRLPRVGVAISPMLIPEIGRQLDEGYDVVHAHVSVVSPVAYVTAALARARALPTVVTYHSVLRHKRHLLRAADAIASIGSSGVLWSAVSSQVARQVGSALATETTILPNGIDLPYWRSVAASTDSNDDVVLVSTMRLHRKKRPVQLARAFARAARRAGLRARLIVAGDGPERGAIERALRPLRGAGAEIRLAGWLGRDSLRQLYASAHGFVSASEREAFGIAALEARASGLPVVAMEEAGSRDFLSHDVNGLLCRDDDDLERQLARFLRDASLRARLAAGASRLEPYDWSAVVPAHEALYRRAMTAGATAAAVAP